MGTQLHAQKQYPVTHIETPRVFKPHRFAVQTSVDTASQSKQRAVDWQTQLSGAKRFGHNLSRVQLHPNPPTQRQVPITQRKGYLQASLVDEEQKQDKEASRTQRKSEGERDSLLARLAQPALTSPNSVAERSLNTTNTNHRSIKESAMSTQEHVQKKPSATMSAPHLRNGFETRGFSVQTKSDKASSQQSGDLKTQLSRATRFGHNLSKMSVPASSSPVAALQTKAPTTGSGNQPLQRMEEPEEEPEQMKAAQPLQRMEEPEEEPEQMKAAQPLQRMEEPEEEPEQMKAAQPLQRMEEPEEEPEQMKAAQPAQRSIQRKPVQKPSSGSGSSMPGGVRAKMEKSFGTNFSNVSIHTDSVQAKSIGALAYTQGSNVHFAPGQYDPQSRSGQALLGHELTHVVQQRAGRVAVPQQSKGAPINADPALEKEADEMGARAAQGKLARVPGAARPMATIASPIQNSTEPVQFFLPMLMGALGGPAGIAGMLGPLLGGGAPGGAPAGGGGFDPLGGIMGAVGGGLGGLMSGNPAAALTGAIGGGLGGMMGGAPAGGAPAGGGGFDPLGGIMGAVGGGLGGLMSGDPMAALTGAVGGGLGGMMGGAPAGGMMGGAPAAAAPAAAPRRR